MWMLLGNQLTVQCHNISHYLSLIERFIRIFSYCTGISVWLFLILETPGSMSGFHKSFAIIFASSSSCFSNAEVSVNFSPWPSVLFFPSFFPWIAKAVKWSLANLHSPTTRLDNTRWNIQWLENKIRPDQRTSILKPTTKNRPPSSVQNVQLDWGLGMESLKAASGVWQKATIRFS